MPGQHPDAEDTAVLPHIEGPPLVRPYVSAAAPMPAQDAFATTLMPQAPPPYQQPPYQQQAYQQQAYRIPGPPQVPPQSQAPLRELGVFEFQHAPGGRASRRAQRQDSPGRRRAAILAAGAGIAAVGAGLAFVLAPSSGGGGHGNDQALPVPVGSYQPDATTEPPSAAPSSSSSSAKTASASPSRKTITRKPTASHAPVAALSPAPAPSTAPTATAAPSTTAPSTPAPTPPAASRQTLRQGMSGQDVADLQQRLYDYGYDAPQQVGYFGSDTRLAVRDFQKSEHIHGDTPGEYGPNTRAALEYLTN